MFQQLHWIKEQWHKIKLVEPPYIVENVPHLAWHIKEERLFHVCEENAAQQESRFDVQPEK